VIFSRRKPVLESACNFFIFCPVMVSRFAVYQLLPKGIASGTI
jgi:hypothetical protein